jgi:phosphoribosylaminoimidazole (AIR) synthetase
MGVGFAVYCAPGASQQVLAAAGAEGLRAHLAGHVTAGVRRVALGELGVEFASDDLELGPRG